MAWGRKILRPHRPPKKYFFNHGKISKQIPIRNYPIKKS
jgi:hypothetical protein